MYGVIIRNKRYINYVDECWYETSDMPKYPFKEKDEAMNAIDQLKSHYVYSAILTDDKGNREEVSSLSTRKQIKVGKVKMNINIGNNGVKNIFRLKL